MLASSLQTPTLADVAIWFGLRHQGFLTACTLPLLLTATLFAGPLFMVLTDKQPRQHLPPWPLPVRNLIAAPLSEELCFRCGLISYLLLCGSPEMQCLFLSPLIFGAAHLHHYLDLTRHQGVSSQQAALIVTAQLFYSTLFGWYAAFLLMRTGSLIPLVVTHSFCNYMGFPSFGDIPRHPQAVLVAGVLVAGVFGFIKLLFPLTDPGLYGYPPGQSYVSSVMHT